MNANVYFPPPNQAGIVLPPVPNIPPIYGDLPFAKEYLDQLKWSRSHNPNGVPATDDEIGQAVSYKAGISFAAVPPPGVPAPAPAWVQGLYNYLDTQFDAVRAEQAILLANSQAGHGAPLYDPNLRGQWAVLVAPNPTSHDDLMAFDYMQCIASAAALGLPPLAANMDLRTRKRQIAAKIGVAMG